MLQIGDRIPDVTLLDHSGREVSLQAEAAAAPLVLFLFPRASTPGCTRQAAGFAQHAAAFAACGYRLYGLSADSVAAQLGFSVRQQLDPVVLLSDPTLQLVAALGSLKPPKSVLRSHYIVGVGGLIVDILRPAKPEESVEKALDYVTSHPKL